jgi:hypothetical protein
MPPAPRLQLASDFRKAVLADPRGVVRLAALSGFAAYPQLSTLLHAPRVRATALTRDRLTALAAAINYTGKVWHER